MPISAIILAGGASVRMGRPKALLSLRDETLVERAARRAAQIADEVIVVSGTHVKLPRLPDGVRVIEDEEALQGPIAGIANGLHVASNEIALVTGCDHPFVNEAVPRLLLARIGGFDLVIPRWGGRLQPLCAIYRRSIADLLAASLARGDHGLLASLAAAHALEVPEADVRTVDPEGQSFLDVDTPEAYAEALRRAAAE